MAYALYLAGFDVKDVHMTDLISGRENLEELNMIVFAGGFSNPMFLDCKRMGRHHQVQPGSQKLLKILKKDTLSLGGAMVAS